MSVCKVFDILPAVPGSVVSNTVISSFASGNNVTHTQTSKVVLLSSTVMVLSMNEMRARTGGNKV